MAAIASKLVSVWNGLPAVDRAQHVLSNSVLYQHVQAHQRAIARYYAGQAEFDWARNTIDGVAIMQFEDSWFEQEELSEHKEI